MYLNKALIIGNLTKDPELRSMPSGIQVASFSVATNRVWKDKNGAKQESADFHNVVVFGRQAETAAQFLRKGSQVLIEGRLQTRSWEAQSGVKMYRTEIVADRVQFGSRPGGASGGAGAPKKSKADEEFDNMGKEDQPAAAAELPTIEYPEENINIDDIPF